jgi:protein-tyrosine-phosphatase
MAPDSESAGPRLLLFRSFDPALAGGGDAADPYDGEVPDPYGGRGEDYALALGLVTAAARGLTAALAEFLEVPAAGPGGS